MKPETKDLVGTQEFYLVINRRGYYLKTSFYEDYEEVKSWGGIIFSEKVSGSVHIFLRCGNSWIKKKVSNLPISKSSELTGWFDISEFDLKNCNAISEIKIGGKEIPQTYQKL